MGSDALHITPDLLERVMRYTTRSGVESREDVLRGVCDALFDFGAERVRFYEIGEETIPRLPHTKALYLTWQDATPGQPVGRQEPGYSIAFERASIYRQRRMSDNDGISFLHPVKESAAQCNENWLEDLDLRDRTWVDVALYDRNDLFGILAFDWISTSADIGPVNLTATEETILLLLGQLAGVQIQSAAPRVETSLRDQVRSLYGEETKHTGDIEPQSTENSLLEKAMQYFQVAVRISSVSLFRYEWARQRLVRESISTLRGPIETPIAAPLPRRVQSFEREVFNVGDKLTGCAWTDESYRRVLDFDSLRRIRPELISEDSASFHDNHIGPVKSIMYGVVGNRDRRYLLRMINNYANRDLPFLSQFELANRFIADLAPIVDNEAAEVRAYAVSSVQTAVNAISNRAQDLFDVVGDALHKTERLAPIAVIAQREARRPHVIHGIDPNRTSRVRLETAQSKAYRAALDAKPGIHISNTSALKLNRGMLKYFPETSYVATLTLVSGGTRGLLIFPVAPSTRAQSEKKTLVSDGVNSFLAQVASLYAQGIEQEYRIAQSQGALQALSLVGHEMSTPLAAMSQLSQRAVRIAQLCERASGRGAVDNLDDLSERLQRQAETLDAAIRLGNVVGRQSEGRLVGVFQYNQLATLLNEAIFRTRVEIKRGLLLQPPGGVRFLRPTGTHDMKLACDGPLLVTALVNLYRNAVKYSVEQSRTATIETNVFTLERDKSVGISITNWGIAVPDYHEELIFDAFTRYAGPIADVTRRGMGLGLYLTRQIARAHRGSAYLSHQDKDTTKPPGGLRPAHRTTFTVTLRKDLDAGPYDQPVQEGSWE